MDPRLSPELALCSRLQRVRLTIPSERATVFRGILLNVDWLFNLGCLGAALAISFFTSMTGISGAFALVPFQISVLGIAGPVVSSTNHLYNLIATPGGIARHLRKGQLAWSLLAVMASGAVPGAVVGAWIRIRFLPDAGNFRWCAASCAASASSTVPR